MADAPTAAVPPPAAASAAPPAVPPAPAAAAAARPVPAGWSAVTEGAATILQKGNEVFYNPAQVVNRDLSVAVLSHFSALRAAAEAAAAGGGKRRAAAGAPPRDPALGPGLRVLEGLAASGLRAIRYALEVPGVARVVANDLDPAVAAALRRNVEHNGGAAARLVVPSTGDARAACMAAPGGFDAVDLDPYGSPGRLLDAAVQAASEGGLLLVTATDMAVLCGNHGEACYAKYGAYPLHRPFCHEQALRVLVGALHAAAARHKRVVTPLLSVSIDFYVRVFVTVHTSAVETKEAATKMGYVFQSQGCDSFFWQRAGRRQQKGEFYYYSYILLNCERDGASPAAAPNPPHPPTHPPTSAQATR
jgi:tRNA (guanine26-N2/guanine27-N2)-dimethyltransferase